MGHRADIEIYRVHRTDQLDLRLHDVCDDVVCIQVQPVNTGTSGGVGSAIQRGGFGESDLCGGVVPYGVVCGIADDADADHSRDSDESASLCTVTSELAAHVNHSDYYGDWSVSAL